ncbi:hypothetical protein C7404_13429 [Paraburkholderia caballeronis]|nr:hypothetical protein C7406_13629 [Paraburkholderia caballeronis]TDV17796.1 hypothetical protein C7404_13429 [Paraburkholderia caballeronis]
MPRNSGCRAGKNGAGPSERKEGEKPQGRVLPGAAGLVQSQQREHTALTLRNRISTACSASSTVRSSRTAGTSVHRARSQVWLTRRVPIGTPTVANALSTGTPPTDSARRGWQRFRASCRCPAGVVRESTVCTSAASRCVPARPIRVRLHSANATADMYSRTSLTGTRLRGRPQAHASRQSCRTTTPDNTRGTSFRDEGCWQKPASDGP